MYAFVSLAWFLFLSYPNPLVSSKSYNEIQRFNGLIFVEGFSQDIKNRAMSNDANDLKLLFHQLGIMSVSLQNAGELTSDMASKLPNWYSSKEGLTGESPAVFGGCGMSFTQAGDSIAPQPIQATKRKEEHDLRLKFQNLSSDLASAACALDPIGISANLDLACDAIDKLVGANPEEALCSQLVQALHGCGQDLVDYGELLCAEDSKSKDDKSSAGRILAQAGQEVRNAGDAFSTIPWAVLHEQLRLNNH